MVRKIIRIDRDRCNGCGLCVTACHEGAIDIVDGKALLTREHYCDGLGDCLPACPMNAISFEEREASAYDAEAVKAAQSAKGARGHQGGCPGSRMHRLAPRNRGEAPVSATSSMSQLRQWPVQIKLVPEQAPVFDGADVLIAADCTAFSCGDFHDRFIRGRVTLIGCPKLDEGDYAEKLTAILKSNNIRSVTLVRMEVPCCGGLERAARTAIRHSGKNIPFRVQILSLEGQILDR